MVLFLLTILDADFDFNPVVATPTVPLFTVFDSPPPFPAVSGWCLPGTGLVVEAVAKVFPLVGSRFGFIVFLVKPVLLVVALVDLVPADAGLTSLDFLKIKERERGRRRNERK